jgi:transposase
LCVVRLPAYAPDINPVEGLWANILGQELAVKGHHIPHP